jgi:hypothetical protein
MRGSLKWKDDQTIPFSWISAFICWEVDQVAITMKLSSFSELDEHTFHCWVDTLYCYASISTFTAKILPRLFSK